MFKVMVWVMKAGFWGISVFIALVLAIYAWDQAARFWSWRTLSKTTILEEAVAYTELYRIDNVHICVYELDCSTGVAGMRLVRDFDAWDLQASLDRTWARRFSDFCPGRTAILGLHLVPVDGAVPRGLRNGTTHARWNFGTNRFLASNGNFSGGAFSALPIEDCTAAASIVTIGAE